MSSARMVEQLQALRRQLAEARAREALYWPAHAAELARVRLQLPPALSRLLVRLLETRGRPVPWQSLAPSIRRARKAAPDRQDEQLVHTQVLRLRAALSLNGFEQAVQTLRAPGEPRGYAVAPGLGADIVRRLGVELPLSTSEEGKVP